MKKTTKIFSALLILLMSFCVFFGCTPAEKPETDTTAITASGEIASATEENTTIATKWQTAVFSEDCTLGEGEKTLIVQVVTDKTITFTIKTDKQTVGEALFEHKLINGDEGAYGLYIKAVNGVIADYDTDKSYWAFYEGESYAATGVDMTEIEEGVIYKLVCTKE